ncbi:NRDE family protein [Haloplanus aerogenes]|uniref:Uncharacterized protein with NRDE domain n=1 Tax=Haloplanus aerogenes TaxID=660522 RepID=A0A3M0DZL8_9EURY|nr:NRDE family protein [Haloplanus aerogenes]AZH25595.1 hypothetical protein DU502_09460 [Haloplanus aerogenes]RMB25316.1 uncharacterized protein with NRDE domain [Haloplanus aerogenes]
MCTLTLAWQVFPDDPVVVAANRDERRDRPSESPQRTEADPVVVAPRDTRAGGTWIGYNEAGLFVGITNRWVDGLDAERSRGLLVADALREPDALSAARLVERSVDAHEYDGFNLVVADENAAFLFEWGGQFRVNQLEPGVHVVVNTGAALGGGGAVTDTFVVPDDPERADRATEQAENARAVRTALTPEPGEDVTAWLDRAGTVLADHEYGVCIHENGYGTRSSSLIRLSADGETAYRFAPGPPCETAYQWVAESQV